MLEPQSVRAHRLGRAQTEKESLMKRDSGGRGLLQRVIGKMLVTAAVPVTLWLLWQFCPGLRMFLQQRDGASSPPAAAAVGPSRAAWEGLARQELESAKQLAESPQFQELTAGSRTPNQPWTKAVHFQTQAKPPSSREH